MNATVYVFWMLVAIGLTVSRVFVVGELDSSPSSLYKDAAHLLFGGAFVYACFVTTDSRMTAGLSRLLWGLLVLSLVAEVAFAIRDNF